MTYTNDLPKLNQIYVNKKDITEFSIFKDLIKLYNLNIISQEDNYYILDGYDEDLDAFIAYWNYSL